MNHTIWTVCESAESLLVTFICFSVGSAFCMEGGFHTFKVSQAKIWPNLPEPNVKCFFADFWSIWCLWICIIVAFILGVDCNRMGIWWWQISSWHWTNVSNKVSPILQILLPIFYSNHHYGEFSRSESEVYDHEN